MRVLLDTNILTRLAEPGHVQHQPALDATTSLRQRGGALFLVPQALYEFWVVSTRPRSANGLGRTPTQPAADLLTFKTLFPLLDDQPALYAEWEKLVIATQVIGKNAHDARLVAAMRVHALTHLLTFNQQDFTRFGVPILTPAAVVSSTTGS